MTRAAPRVMERFPNLVAMFVRRAGEKGDALFLWHKRDGAWHATTWREAADRVARLAAAFAAIGIRPGDRVMLVAENRPEWCIADLAIMAAGAVSVPTYTTNSERDHLHILDNSGAAAVIVSTEKLAKTLLPAILRSNSGQTVIGIDAMRAPGGGIAFHRWDDLLAHDPAAELPGLAATREDLACLIYTSGTGGAPRGVRQHHGAILHNVEATSALIAEDFGWDDEVFLSFLPLSHAYEHTGGQCLPIGLGAQIYYAEGLDKLAANIAEVRPTIMFVVPRLFEVLRQRIQRQIERQGGMPARLLAAALTVGRRRAGRGLRIVDRPAQAAVALLFKPKIAKRFGGRLKAMVSGGAPLNAEVGLFFDSLGLTFLQGYGQTEAAPVISCNRPAAGVSATSVGPPIAGAEVRIADDGEILVRGELVMHGYWRDEAESTRVLEGGWLHTGDIGAFDANGRLTITDRKKDLIVTDKGDNVAPQKVEGMLTLAPEIAQAMIAGDRRPYIVAVIVPDAEWTQQWCAQGGARCDAASLAATPAYRAAIQAAVDRINRDLSVTERVRRFLLADEPFALDNEELTPSMKIRRHMIRARYGDRLEALYTG